MQPAADWSGRRVVVTGAGGFIGSHLVERLAQLGAEVTAFVRYNSRNEQGLLEATELERELRVKYGDITELDTVRSLVKGADVVFHLAALVGIPYSYVHPTEVVDVNTIGTLNVLIAAREHDASKVVVTSTSEVYGSALFTPMGESHPKQPQSPYSASKIAADALALSFNLSFVGDTVAGFLRAAESDASIGQEINFGNGRSISIGELAEKIVGLVGRDIPVRQSEERIRPASSEVDDLVADATKARELLGWEPEVSLDEGLVRTIDWVRENPRLYDPAVYRI